MNRRQFLGGAASLAVAPRVLAMRTDDVPVALVTADREARLVVVELPHGLVRGYVPTPPSPRSIEAVGTAAVVAHSELGCVSIVDTRTLAVAHVLHRFDEPRYTAAHPDGRYAYVTDAGSGEVVAVDVVRGRVVAREAVGPHARHIALNARRRTLWVALGSKAEELAVVDVSRAARPRLVRRFRPAGLAHDVAVAADGRHLWVSSGDRDELYVYDARSGRLLARPSGDWPPQHVAFADDRVYVTSGWSGTLRVHRLDGTPLGRAIVPVGSYNVTHAAGWVVTPSLGHGDVSLADERGRVVMHEKVAASSHDACIVRVSRRA